MKIQLDRGNKSVELGYVMHSRSGSGRLGLCWPGHMSIGLLPLLTVLCKTKSGCCRSVFHCVRDSTSHRAYFICLTMVDFPDSPAPSSSSLMSLDAWMPSSLRFFSIIFERSRATLSSWLRAQPIPPKQNENPLGLSLVDVLQSELKQRLQHYHNVFVG